MWSLSEAWDNWKSPKASSDVEKLSLLAGMAARIRPILIHWSDFVVIKESDQVDSRVHVSFSNPRVKRKCKCSALFRVTKAYAQGKSSVFPILIPTSVRVTNPRCAPAQNTFSLAFSPF